MPTYVRNKKETIKKHLENFENYVIENPTSWNDFITKILDRNKFIYGNYRIPDNNYLKSDLKLDTLYMHQELDYAYCLKFYPEGLVISISVDGPVISSKPLQDAINEFFNRSFIDCRGKYKIERNKLNFSTKSEKGEVFYSGEVKDNQLDLNSYSKINGSRSRGIYELTIF